MNRRRQNWEQVEPFLLSYDEGRTCAVRAYRDYTHLIPSDIIYWPLLQLSHPWVLDLFHVIGRVCLQYGRDRVGEIMASWWFQFHFSALLTHPIYIYQCYLSVLLIGFQVVDFCDTLYIPLFLFVHIIFFKSNLCFFDLPKMVPDCISILYWSICLCGEGSV